MLGIRRPEIIKNDGVTRTQAKALPELGEYPVDGL